MTSEDRLEIELARAKQRIEQLERELARAMHVLRAHKMEHLLHDWLEIDWPGRWSKS